MEQASPKLQGGGNLLDGFAGVQQGKLFSTTATWVDTDKAPGHTSQVKLLGIRNTLREIATLSYFLYSPNLVWFSMVLTVNILVPYEIEAAYAGYSAGWVGRRFAINFAVAFLYYGFFFYGLYGAGWANRKFRPGVYPSTGNMAHNLWYWCLGVVQWSASECLMVRLWAQGRVPYISDAELRASPWLWLILAVWILLIPIWRDLHFYFAHRFSHIRAFYKYVHSLHHRNTDPEPFSGLCMHPVEHLVYFSCALVPSLYVRLPPIIYMWNFLHLAIAPGAGHSGWEDHFQSDQYHYLHHAKFECNYGSPSSGWIDQLMGTFREKLGTSEAYTGEYKDDEDKGIKAAKGPVNKVWSSQSYLSFQSSDHFAYTLFCLLVTSALYWGAVLNPASPEPIRTVAGVSVGTLIGYTVAYGPVAFAMVLWALYDKMSWRWPFQKESLGTFGFFCAAGWLSCMVPISHFVQLGCTP